MGGVCQGEFAKAQRDVAQRKETDVTQQKVLMSTVKFIGELCLSGLMPCNIVCDCQQQLIPRMLENENMFFDENCDEIEVEDDLECACTLPVVTGKRRDA